MSMNTPAFIGRLEPDGTITGIHCHNNGYIECVGSLLEQFYSDRNKINELIELGSISCLGPEIGEKINFDTDYSKYERKQCIAYHRDRNEHLRIYINLDIHILQSDYPYVYAFDENDDWYVYHDDRKQLLSDALKLFESDNTESEHQYLIIFDEDECSISNAKLCDAIDVRDIVLQMAEHTGCRTELFENALSGMKTDKQRIELFNRFSQCAHIDHIYIVGEEMGLE